MNEVHGQLESNGSHVCALEGRREVEVEVQELVHAAVLLDLQRINSSQLGDTLITERRLSRQSLDFDVQGTY